MAHSELGMVRHTNNVILSMTILIVCSVRYIFSMDWKEKNMGTLVITVPEGEMDKIKCLEKLNELCERNQELPISMIDNFVKKSSSTNFAEIPENARIIPFYQSLHHSICSCGLEYKRRDLGRGYYPRYLTTGECKADSCTRHYQCVEKEYKVRVLKRKDFTDPVETDSSGLPANLQELWKAETIDVGVACTCVPSIEKYETT